MKNVKIKRWCQSSLFFLLLFSSSLFAIEVDCTKLPVGVNESKTTPVTDENYSLAETDGIIEGYVKKIAPATNTNGVGVLIHYRKGADPKDRTIMRINFDTIYSWAIVDLTYAAKLTMPETNGCYQSAWLITEEHYNPMAFNKHGEYKINKENNGSKYIMIAMRTQVNMRDPKDLSCVSELEDKLRIIQTDKGSYAASNKWNMDEILAMRAKYQRIEKEKGITSEMMFGKKEDLSLENHSAGAAYGWGGFTKDQAELLGVLDTFYELHIPIVEVKSIKI